MQQNVDIIKPAETFIIFGVRNTYDVWKAISNFQNHYNLIKNWFRLFHFVMNDPVARFCKILQKDSTWTWTPKQVFAVNSLISTGVWLLWQRLTEFQLTVY